MDHLLNVQPRLQRGKSLHKHRKAGLIPGNIYGLKEPSSAVWVHLKEFNRILAHIHVGSLLYLQYFDQKERVPVILRRIDSNIRSKYHLHLEFQKINLSQEVAIEVPIELTGEAPALKKGYLLETPCTTVKLSVLPTSIPEVLSVDVSSLSSLDDQITVSDLQLPQNATVLSEPHTVLVAVVQPTQETEQKTPQEEISRSTSVPDISTPPEEPSAKQ